MGSIFFFKLTCDKVSFILILIYYNHEIKPYFFLDLNSDDQQKKVVWQSVDQALGNTVKLQ